MDPLVLQDEEDRRYYFHPFGRKFLSAKEWDGALADALWLWPWIRPYKKQIAAAMLLFLITTLAAISIPRLVALIVDKVFVAKTAPFETYALLLGFVILTRVVSDLTYKWMITKAGQAMTKKLRFDVFYQLGQFPLSFFDKNSSGRLISRCVNDVSNLSAFFTMNFFTVVSDLFIVVGCVVVMATLAPLAALIVLLALLPLTVYMLNVSQAQMRWGRDQRNVLSRLTAHAADTMNNLAVLHSQPFGAKWNRRHERLQGQYVRLTTRSIITWGSFSSTHVFVMGLTYATVIVYGVSALKNNEMTIGAFIASCTYVGLIFGPFFEISEKLNTLVTALGSAKRLKAFLPAPVEKIQESAHEELKVPAGDVRFANITFHYREDRPLFRDVSLTLAEGEVTAVVGRTGSGKTTLAHLLMGLYPIQSGDIFWGERNLKDFNPLERARFMGHVSQDLFLFSDTLRENLRLWREDVSDAMIMERLKRVGLWEKIERLPEGLNMIVKAETLALSQGEKQLLLLCRALLQDPQLLVFDEATASLDQLSEEVWLKHIDELFAGRTTLFIAHRLETLRLATRVVVLENGVIKKVIQKPRGKFISEEELHDT